MSYPASIEVGPDALIEWMYPNIYCGLPFICCGLPLSRLVVSMNHVRASADLVIEFDSKRDGFVIRTDHFKEVGDALETTRENVEMAFIPALTIDDTSTDE